jgi:S-layer homology domain
LYPTGSTLLSELPMKRAAGNMGIVMRRVLFVVLVVGGLLFTGALAGATSGLPPGGSFIDDDGSVHEPSIEAIFAEGITSGCGTLIFCPEDPVTRGQMAAFLTRGIDLPTPVPGDRFSDDDASIFEDSIERIAEAGITLGCNPPSNTRFCPDDPVTRGQMAAFLTRALSLSAADGPDRFVDDNFSVFEDSIQRLAQAGITAGCNPPQNDRFCPDAPVTRGQMATFLTRALGLTPHAPPPRPPGTLGEQCAVVQSICPPIGNPDGTSAVPSEGRAEPIGTPDTTIGDGSPESCTTDAVVAAVALGGTITFNCGADPILIEMTATAQVFNNANPDVVIDGGGLVTLSGMGQRRILYMNTCDPALVWTSSQCQNQSTPRLTIQNINFVRGMTTGEDTSAGGGAVWVRGGRFKIVNVGFFNNTCTEFGPDVAGAAVRVFSQYNNMPVYVTNSTFGGAPGFGNECSNGGGTASIGVSWTITNSLFSDNNAIGIGANPQRPGTPGGGNGGSVYLDGNLIHLVLDGTAIYDSNAREGGGAVFFVSNDRTGTMTIRDSVLRRNVSERFETAGLPGIFVLAAAPPTISNSIIE